jgi:hypothetical protein
MPARFATIMALRRAAPREREKDSSRAPAEARDALVEARRPLRCPRTAVEADVKG